MKNKTLGNIITAPFTPQQVERLNWYQNESGWHPFTCGTLGCYEQVKLNDHTISVSTTLVATEEGWVCPKCDCTQNWAWAFMANPDLKAPGI